MFEFGGIVFHQLKDTRDDLECIFNNDDEILLATKKTFEHREDGLNFDYKYLIHAIDLYTIGEDDNAFNISIHLVVSPAFIDKELKEDIKDYNGGYCDYDDIFFYGLRIPLLRELYYVRDNIEEFLYKVGNIIEPLDSMKGFYLDRPINKLGSTGWDMIFNCLDGKSFIHKVLERYD